jgi:hypothetical protein
MDDLDRILISDEPIAPSAGFAAGVMEAVETAARAADDFPFPWRLFGAGVLCCLAWAASCVWLFEVAGESAARVLASVTAARAPLESATLMTLACLAALAIRRIRADLRHGQMFPVD